MTSITPIKELNNHAYKMVSGIVHNNPDKTKAIKAFLKHANDNNIQGPAIVAYHTQYNAFRYDKINKLNLEDSLRARSIPEIFEKEIENNPEVEKEINLFAQKLCELYPNSLGDRISLASQSAVTADKVEPKSWFKKLFVVLNRFLKADV